MEEMKKKKFPKWVVVLLVLFGFFVVGSAVISFGIRHFLGGDRGQMLAQEAAEAIMEKTIEQGGGKMDPHVEIDMKHANFPSDLAVFSPSEFKGHVNVMGMESFSWKTDKPVAEVAQFYLDKMVGGGWQMMLTDDSGKNYGASFKKGNKQAMLNVSDNEGTTEINVIYGAAP